MLRIIWTAFKYSYKIGFKKGTNFVETQLVKIWSSQSDEVFGVRANKLLDRIVSDRILPYHIVSYRILPYHIVSYRILSYLIVSYRILSYLIVSYRILPYHIVQHLFCIVSYRKNHPIKKNPINRNFVYKFHFEIPVSNLFLFFIARDQA